MNRIRFVATVLAVGSISLGLICCGSNINTVGDPHFTADGEYLHCDSDLFMPQQPNRIRFFVEVSGSMNGFFRANRPTNFKTDVWEVVSYFSSIIPQIDILTNDGSIGASMSVAAFQQKMNTGAFVSSASTRTPVMLQSIINTIQPDAGEVGILVSDMKYSPVGAPAPDVLLQQYSTDISRILGSYGKAVCVVAAVSDYLDKKGEPITERSPYYFVIIGNDCQVAYMRNAISTLINNRGHYVDNIESGFCYGTPSYSFGIPNNCVQLGNEPTFYGFDTYNSDTATINLKINLANYRWIIADTSMVRSALKVRTQYGSQINIGDINIDVQNITNRQLNRTATATIELKVFDMPIDSDVIEWNLELPDGNVSNLYEFYGATSESDVTKSYSFDAFLRGMFYGSITNESLKPNYILVSKID